MRRTLCGSTGLFNRIDRQIDWCDAVEWLIFCVSSILAMEEEKLNYVFIGQLGVL